MSTSARVDSPFSALLEGESVEAGQEAERGAYVLVRDPYQTFYQLCHRFANRRSGGPRALSSHASELPQYEVRDGGHVVLFGFRTYNGIGCTFFQMEPFGAWESLVGALMHAATWLGYEVTGRNVGPRGTSAYTEADPLVLSSALFLEKPK